MKIYINDAREGWICDRIKKEFYELNSEISTDSIEESDLVWVAAPWMFKKHGALKDKKSIFSIYHITPNKFNKSRLLKRISRDI